jgi:energy-coupling factor transporter ATP-binding protein EcfA2
MSVRLAAITVTNFRSITEARKIKISNLTTLVGPNNEGKSNILRALVLAMNAIADASPKINTTARILSRLRPNVRRTGEYFWADDFPLKIQKTSPEGVSTVLLEFAMTDAEARAFLKDVGSKINTVLPVLIEFGQAGLPKISISKQGRAAGILNAKSEKIAKFIATRMDLQYIPAVRTAQSAMEIVQSLVQRELAKIEQDANYKSALASIEALQAPILKDLSKNITQTMKGFLPTIVEAKIVIRPRDRSYALRDIAVMMLNDGVETPLEAKGDGVQSLAALALMRHASLSRSQGKEVLIALEEPESHLHPEAIRRLRVVLEELSNKHQVVLTTHNPIFANRVDVGQNIIVRKNKAYSAESVKDVREVLGVRLDDNLTSAEIVLLVEGDEDKTALASVMSKLSADVALGLQSGRLVIDVLSGASSLTHRARLHGDNLCKIHAVLDHDNAGKTAFSAAERAGVLRSANVNFTSVAGKIEAELEDLYVSSVYEDIIKEEVGLPWIEQGLDRSKKWSDRLRNLIRRAGRAQDDAAIDRQVMSKKRRSRMLLRQWEVTQFTDLSLPHCRAPYRRWSAC